MKKICMIMVAVILMMCVFGTTLSASAVTMYVRGDADADDSVNSVDVSVIQRKVAIMEVNPFRKKSADVDKDGDVTIVDATLIQRYLANFKDPWKIGSLFDPYETPFIPNT